MSDADVPITVREFERLIVAQSKRFDELREADYKAIAAALASADKAVAAALETVRASASQADSVAERRLVEAKADLEHRLDALNKLKETMATKADLQITSSRLEDVRSSVDKMEAREVGRAGGLKDYIGWIVAAVTIVSALVGFALLLRR